MTAARNSERRAPLTDATSVVVAQLVDDAQSERREPSHSDIEFEINRCGLTSGDPKAQGQNVGKAKRVRTTLSWAMEFNNESGEILVANLISHIRARGGFRPDSPNYCGSNAIRDATAAFRVEGYELTDDGELRPAVLENLTGVQMSDALRSYIRRAQRGVQDAALLTGTSKDLLEATAAHVLKERRGDYSIYANFPMLLGLAFTELGLSTPADKPQSDELPHKRMERAMYELGCAINHLRNKEGTGHGRPWLPSVTNTQSKVAVEMMGTIAEFLLHTHDNSR